MATNIEKLKSQAVPTNGLATLRQQYGCGPVALTGSDDALYERHLLFDHVVDLREATARDRYDAIARSVRDILSQRWLRTNEVYERENPKRVYYLSMEFLIGRLLESNVSNLLLTEIAEKAVHEKDLNWFGRNC
jgi:glycogen phosphorylase